MRAFVVLILAALVALFPVAVCYAEDVEPEATSTAEDVVVEDIVDDWAASLPIHAGFLWNADRQEWTQYINLTPLSYKVVTFEIGLEVNPNNEDGPRGGLVALTYDFGNLRDYGVDVHWAEYFGVNAGPVGRYDFATGEWNIGFILSFVDLSPID